MGGVGWGGEGEGVGVGGWVGGGGFEEEDRDGGAWGHGCRFSWSDILAYVLLRMYE